MQDFSDRIYLPSNCSTVPLCLMLHPLTGALPPVTAKWQTNPFSFYLEDLWRGSGACSVKQTARNAGRSCPVLHQHGDHTLMLPCEHVFVIIILTVMPSSSKITNTVCQAGFWDIWIVSIWWNFATIKYMKYFSIIVPVKSWTKLLHMNPVLSDNTVAGCEGVSSFMKYSLNLYRDLLHSVYHEWVM